MSCESAIIEALGLRLPDLCLTAMQCSGNALSLRIPAAEPLWTEETCLRFRVRGLVPGGGGLGAEESMPHQGTQPPRLERARCSAPLRQVAPPRKAATSLRSPGRLGRGRWAHSISPRIRMSEPVRPCRRRASRRAERVDPASGIPHRVEADARRIPSEPGSRSRREHV